ncbi:YjfI family protein [Gallaecimonas xiamenensis]|uniref:Cytoplasmic protein n=1 Tax=Gallaecimonas xiamenensis 3-C-1 TaxID=745411 RepID=K2J5V5_9GAMM|nr:DUF2170 family protein [Gallaecimonas xiamenensis]EKE70252.1 hypothetical protein B3C1_14158 [Gallaecimonas xiamenensis 3-C-1]
MSIKPKGPAVPAQAATIDTIARHLSQSANAGHTGCHFDCTPISGEVEVLQIVVQGREELPIFLSLAEDQVLVMSFLWEEAEVAKDKRLAMLETMLELNIPMPLSAFAKMGDRYLIFGALSVHSSLADIEHELVVLSDNTLDILDDMSHFLEAL